MPQVKSQVFKGALCGSGEETQTQNYDINNIYEVIRNISSFHN